LGSSELTNNTVETLRANAERCRSLAEAAIDREVADALREIARDMEQAASAIEGNSWHDDGDAD